MLGCEWFLRARFTRFQREIAGIACAPFPFQRSCSGGFFFFLFFSFVFSKSMRFEGCAEVGGSNGWTRRRMMAGKERSLSDQTCCSD